MAVRIGWDKYEVALLIDACNKIRDKKIDKAECVHKLSKLLRQRAKANGIKIDEVFRNENGITLQMTKMEYLLTDGEKGLPGASKLYIEMAKMSKLNSDEFEKILTLAKEQIENKESMNNMNAKGKFIQWLSSNSVNKYSLDTIVNALDEGSEYCCSRGLSKVSFWNMNNKKEFISVATKLLGMKIYRLMHRKTATVLDKAVPLYKQFLKQSEMRSDTKTPDVEILIEDSNDNIKEVMLIDNTTELSLNENSVFEYDFHNPSSLRFTKPIKAAYFDEIASESTSWQKLFMDLLKVLYEDYADIFKRIWGGVRNLERTIGQICRKTARLIMEEDKKKVTVTSKNLSDFLGKEHFNYLMANKKDEIGISRGLAWTQVGGDTLQIEVNVMPGEFIFCMNCHRQIHCQFITVYL